jgi:hypothetical protein
MTLNTSVSVVTKLDRETRTRTPQSLEWEGAVVLLEHAKLIGHSRIGCTVYLHYVAVGARHRYELKVSLDDRQWILVDVTLAEPGE